MANGNGNGNGWKKLLITALLSIVLTGGSAWFAWGQKAVTRAEVSNMIQMQDPYLPDRQTVQQLKSSVDGLTDRVQTQGEAIARMSAILDRVERSVDRWMAGRR